MVMTRMHRERHFIHRAGWLRAAVLGANDGIVSTAALVLGVAASQPELGPVLVAGVAGLVSGALSMAVGEYVSVGSQADTEASDIALEKRELASAPQFELDELTAIYVDKGLTPALAREVAKQLTAKDALAAHLNDELGIHDNNRARPMQAALSSAVSFALGAALPILAVAFAPTALRVELVIAIALLALAGLGALGAKLGGAPKTRAIARVLIGGALAMVATMGIGALIGQTLG